MATPRYRKHATSGHLNYSLYLAPNGTVCRLDVDVP